jgi:hypothetical protein
MPKVIETTVFKFEELNDEAKQFAIEKYRNTERDGSGFVDQFTPDCVEAAKEAGFEEPEFAYSLSYSQGDGLSFKAKKYNKLVDLFKEVLGPGKDKTAQLLADNMTQVYKGNNGHYCYAAKSDIDIYLENWTSSINVLNTERIDEVVGKVLAKLEDIYIELCAKLEKQGYTEIEYRDSDEAITETIIANEYDFEEDGRRF